MVLAAGDFVYAKFSEISLDFIRLLRVVITPSVMLRGENDSKQSDEFQAILRSACYNSTSCYFYRQV